MKNNLNSKKYGGHFFLDDFTVVGLRGIDTLRFLNGQFTNDLSKLDNGYGQLNARLDRTGKVKAFFYTIKKDDTNFYILIHQELAISLISDLEKFIIMDDVEIFEIETDKIYCEISYDKPYDSTFSIPLYSEMVHVSWTEYNIDKSKLLDPEEVRALEFFSVFPKWNKTVFPDQLINETSLALDALDLKKGCFLGQETVAKVEVGRGASYFPVFLEVETEVKENYIGKIFNTENRKGGRVLDQLNIDGLTFLMISLFRDFRVFNRSISLFIEDVEIIGELLEAPVWMSLDPCDKAIWLYEEGGLLFQKDQEEEALKMIKRSIKLRPDFADAYESLGVILGRHEEYQNAINWMDKLLVVDPDSVMAHTNKSLYLMKLGKIEEAEEEKAQATLKGFASFGKEASSKKLKEEQEQIEKEEMLRRKSMFEEVLDIDSEDTIANYGLGDIYYNLGNYEEAKPYLTKVLEVDSKYSVAYLLLGKILLELGLIDEASSVFTEGIKIASKNGDLMPANSMQSELVKISNP